MASIPALRHYPYLPQTRRIAARSRPRNVGQTPRQPGLAKAPVGLSPQPQAETKPVQWYKLPRWAQAVLFAAVAGPGLAARIWPEKIEVDDEMEVSQVGVIQKIKVEPLVVSTTFHKDRPWVMAYQPPVKVERPLNTSIKVKEPDPNDWR